MENEVANVKNMPSRTPPWIQHSQLQSHKQKAESFTYSQRQTFLIRNLYTELSVTTESSAAVAL